MFVAYRYDAALSSKAVIDACRPYDRLAEFPLVAEASRELREKVRRTSSPDAASSDPITHHRGDPRVVDDRDLLFLDSRSDPGPAG